MERKVKLTLAYDGTGFHGWQLQAGLRTVQEVVAVALGGLAGRPVEVVGASRTDAGVHARGQVAHAVVPDRIPVGNLPRALNGRLPADVSVIQAVEVPPAFHAARDARGKRYRYTLYNASGRPVEDLRQRYCWHVWQALDVERMRAAAAVLVGRHDFAGLANQGSPRADTVRTIFSVTLSRPGREIHIDVEGDGFLYNQVRVLVGTLVEVGRGHWPVERVQEILATRDRGRAGPTAPPQGLCLEWVAYGPPLGAEHGT